MMVHYACAQAELRRLTSLRRLARAQGEDRDSTVYSREINALLQLSWPCGDPGCSDRVTLGEDVARRVEAAP